MALQPVLRVLICCACFLSASVAVQAQERLFIGSEACRDCHAEQYENYKKYSKKAKSSSSIKVMAGKLTADELKECFGCHTTGYGKPGGFVSFEATPKLADAGCEVCHGPGSAHAAAQDKQTIIRKLPMSQCRACHNEARVRSFGFKPITHAGAH